MCCLLESASALISILVLLVSWTSCSVKPGLWRCVMYFDKGLVASSRVNPLLSRDVPLLEAPVVRHPWSHWHDNNTSFNNGFSCLTDFSSLDPYQDNIVPERFYPELSKRWVERRRWCQAARGNLAPSPTPKSRDCRLLHRGGTVGNNLGGAKMNLTYVNW